MRVKRLRSDTGGVDELIGVFVFVAVFIVITALLISLMQASIVAGRDAGSFNIYEGTEIIAGREYGMMDPDGGYNFTEADSLESWDHDAAESVFFDDTTLTDDTIEVQLVMGHEIPTVRLYEVQEDLYEDFLMFYTEWGWWSNDEVAVSFPRIISSQVAGTNMSLVSIWLHNNNYTLFVMTPGSPEFHKLFVDMGAFNVRLGLLLDDDFESLKKSSMWTILGQLMTASIPDVHPVVNYFISVPFWASVGFLAVMVVRAFIPFLGG